MADASSTVASLARTLTSTVADGVVHSIAHWKVLLLGQCVSFILAVAGATNEVLALECGVSAPSTYNAFGYALTAILGGILLRRESRKKCKETSSTEEEQESFRGDHNVDDDDDDDELTLDDGDGHPARRSACCGVRRRHPHGRKDHRLRPTKYPILFGRFSIHAPWYYYLAVSFIEAQAYYLIFLAFRYTSFTFVYLSDALAIPSAMLFTKLFMKRSYLWVHLIGGAICIAGIVVNTVSDMSLSDGLEHVASSDHIKGDIFAIVGAVLLGLDDVLSEILVSNYGGVMEMLLMKGIFGALISIVQLIIFESGTVATLFGSEGKCEVSWRMTLFAIHVVTRAMDVAGEMQFLYISEAALLNLLLLTSDLFAAIFDLVTVGLSLTPFFYISFFCIASGIVIYEAGPSPAEQPATAGTPMAIEFREKKHELVHTASSAVTEQAGNLSRYDRELT